MNWATIIPVLVGSVIALASSISVEYLKVRQTTDVAIRERENAIRQQSRDGLHALVTEVQNKLEKMILLAYKMPNDALEVEEGARLRSEFDDVTLGLVRLVSRLPSDAWRKSVQNAIGQAKSAIAPQDSMEEDSEDPAWRRATEKYEEAIQSVAEPLQRFYGLALDSNARS